MDAKHETLVRAGRSPLSTTALLTVCVCVWSAMWTVVSGWLSPEQRKKTLLVNKDELAKYVAADQLEPHMRSAAAQ